MSPMHWRRVFWGCALGGLLLSLYFDIQLHSQTALTGKAQGGLVRTYDGLSGLDRLTILFHQGRGTTKNDAKIEAQFDRLDALFADDENQSKRLADLRALTRREGSAGRLFKKSEDDVTELTTILRQSEERRLVAGMQGLQAADGDFKAQSLVANSLDLFLVVVLGAILLLERRLNRRLEDDLGGTVKRLSATNAALMEADLTRTQLLRVTVHDLKNPLGSIRGFAELLREEADHRETVAQLSERIRRISDGTLALVNSLLQPSAAISGQTLRKESLDLADLIGEVCEELEPLAKKKQQKIEWHPSAGGPDAAVARVEADPVRLHDVFTNVIGNALKFSPKNSTVKVSLRRRAGVVEARVEDSGPGFSEADRARAFRPGQTLSAKPTGGEISTGMGLYSVKKTLEQHQGDVRIEAGASGGACMVVRLPAPGAPTDLAPWTRGLDS